MLIFNTVFSLSMLIAFMLIKNSVNERTRNKLTSSVNFNGGKFTSGHLEIYDEVILQVLMNTLTYINPSNLHLSRILLHDAVYGCMIPKWSIKKC